MNKNKTEYTEVLGHLFQCVPFVFTMSSEIIKNLCCLSRQVLKVPKCITLNNSFKKHTSFEYLLEFLPLMCLFSRIHLLIRGNLFQNTDFAFNVHQANVHTFSTKSMCKVKEIYFIKFVV